MREGMEEKIRLKHPTVLAIVANLLYLRLGYKSHES